MLLAFAGDAFLVHRAARRALVARGFKAHEVTELAENMTAPEVAQLAAQSGLFGQVALLLDFGAAFKGQADVKPRNEVMKVLEAGSDSLIVVLDHEATPARQKLYKAVGHFEFLPTPRFGALTHWVREELRAEGIAFEADVPETLADLFGEDLPGIASEVQKLAALGENLSAARVREVAGRPAARDAFALIEAAAKGDAAAALAVVRSLVDQGEAPARVLGAVTWQYQLVARCVGMQESRARLETSLVAQTLKVKPFVAQKALALARPLGESTLRRALQAILKADVAIKSGRDEVWALEALALELAALAR